MVVRPEGVIGYLQRTIAHNIEKSSFLTFFVPVKLSYIGRGNFFETSVTTIFQQGI